jgi:H+/Cl- antiporter ClcA
VGDQGVAHTSAQLPAAPGDDASHGRGDAIRLAAVAIVLGVVNALVFAGFEWVVDDGSDWVWNTVAGSDSARWRVIPLAIAGSIVLSLVVRLASEKRVVAVRTNPLEETGDQERATVGSVLVTLGVGAVSLVGGASLGPEAPLSAASMGMGRLFARGQAVVLASVGALLVAFFGSPVPMLVPLLLLQKRKLLTVGNALIVLACGLTALGTLRLVSNNGYGSFAPSSHYTAKDIAMALALGAVAVLAATWLRRTTERFGRRTKRLDERLHWTASAALFGAGLGVLYLAGGQSVEFSGSAGTTLLAQTHADDGALVLLGLAAVKLLATGWCLACGYRGGPVFPSVYVGVAISLSLGSLAGPGATLGAVTGILTALTSPVLGAVMAFSLISVKLCGLALAGTAGAAATSRMLITRSSAADDAK